MGRDTILDNFQPSLRDLTHKSGSHTRAKALDIASVTYGLKTVPFKEAEASGAGWRLHDYPVHF
jgi:hypothetical protein